jgi:tetratricopeptide (TPR) repeat protein
MHRVLVLAVLVSCTHCGPHRASEGDVQKSERRLSLAKEYLEKHELEAAEAEANKAIGFNPGNEEAYDVRGLVHFIRAFDAQRQLEVDDCLTGIDAESVAADKDAELTAAEADFAKAATVTPEYGEAWAHRGAAANLLGNYDEAIEYLAHALGNPVRLVDPALTRTNLAWAYFNKGDMVRAAKELRTVKQFAPKHCVATYRLGRVYFARGEWENAAREFLQVGPECGSQEASFYLMKARLELGLVDDARAARDACLAFRSNKSCIAAQCQAGMP